MNGISDFKDIDAHSLGEYLIVKKACFHQPDITLLVHS